MVTEGAAPVGRFANNIHALEIPVENHDPGVAGVGDIQAALSGNEQAGRLVESLFLPLPDEPADDGFGRPVFSYNHQAVVARIRQVERAVFGCYDVLRAQEGIQPYFLAADDLHRHESLRFCVRLPMDIVGVILIRRRRRMHTNGGHTGQDSRQGSRPP